MISMILTGFGAAKYIINQRQTFFCCTVGCPNKVHSSASTSLAKFCACCWRRSAMVQDWINHHAMEHLLATGDEKERLQAEMKAALLFARTASPEEIAVAHEKILPIDAFRE